jgi:hypothetical protein
MLTIQIDDAQLEQRIVETAKAIGQTAQEFLKDLAMRETKTITKLPFEIPRLDYRNHITIIDYELEDEESIDDAPLFQNVGDTIEFAKKLREEAWQRK